MTPEILHLYAWDVAFELSLQEAGRAFPPAEGAAVRPEKAAPRDLPPLRSIHVPLPAVAVGPLAVSVSANLYQFGVVALTLRYRAEGNSLLDFVPQHAPRLEGGATLDRIARQSLDAILEKVREGLKRPRISPEEPEAYTVFRFSPEDVGMGDAAAWLIENGRQVAGLLTRETDPGRLSAAEIDETLSERYSYYRDDLVVMDWDAAIIVDREPAADVLRVFELANLQLVEYRHYDQELDRVVSRAYDDLERFKDRSIFSFRPAELLRSLREMRVSVSEVAEEVENATKYIGDWHLARQYMGCARRFHLAEWRHTVEERLRTVDELYNLVATESSNQKMLILESIIVILFVVDLVVLAIAAAR